VIIDRVTPHATVVGAASAAAGVAKLCIRLVHMRAALSRRREPGDFMYQRILTDHRSALLRATALSGAMLFIALTAAPALAAGGAGAGGGAGEPGSSATQAGV
jgi:hypothetical protein